MTAPNRANADKQRQWAHRRDMGRRRLREILLGLPQVPERLLKLPPGDLRAPALHARERLVQTSAPCRTFRGTRTQHTRRTTTAAPRSPIHSVLRAMLRCWLLDAAEAATTQFLLGGERGFPTLYSLLLGRRLSLSLAPARAKRALAPPPPLSTLFPFDSVHARSDSVVSPEFPLVSPPGARRGGHACARRLQGQGARPARPAIARGPGGAAKRRLRQPETARARGCTR